jgi:molybdopterin-guanine dinucleotide biosynthesis protein A
MQSMENLPLYIFCGGKSRRMGRNKSLLTYGGETLLNRQVRRSSEFFGEITFLSGSNRYDIAYRQVPDVMDDAGPLSGLLTALNDAAINHSRIAVLPVDLPFLSEQTLKMLATNKPAVQTDAMILRCGEVIQPLAGIYNCSLLKSLRDYLNSGQRMVMKFLEQIDVEYLEVKQEELRNINYPDDYRNLERK